VKYLEKTKIWGWTSFSSETL